jgi:hypothetical protein
MKHILPVALVICAAVIGGAAMNRGRGQADASSALADYRPPVLPARTSAAPAVIPEPPSVPQGAEALAPIAFTVTTSWSGSSGTRTTSQRVTRTADRVHLVIEGERQEWLFERNPVDGRRVSGYLIDHEKRQILTYQESDLRNEQQLRGWADALMMRFDRAVLPRLRRTNEHEIMRGATFTRHVAPDENRAEPSDGVLEVWWSDAFLLPLRLKVRQQGVLVSAVIDRLEPVVSLTLLADPRTRLARYETLDVADSRERRR